MKDKTTITKLSAMRDPNVRVTQALEGAEGGGRANGKDSCYRTTEMQGGRAPLLTITTI